MYLKNQGGYKMSYFKGKAYEDIRPIFEKVWDQIQAFVPMDSEKENESAKIAVKSTKRPAEEELKQDSPKRQKINESLASTEVSQDKELSEEELQQMMIIIPKEGMNVEALQTKYPIIDWEFYSEESRRY